MVKKLKSISAKKSAPASGLLDSQLAGSVKESAQQIWLAGMGAFSKAQEEGGKVFDALVKEGMSLQRKTQAVAEEKIGEVTGKMSAMAGSVTNKAGQNWDKLESIFEARTAKALNKLGVPTAKDVDALVKRVDALAAAVAKLAKTEAPAKAVRAPRAAKAAKAVKAVKAAKPANAAANGAAKPAAPAAPAVVKRAATKRAARKSTAAPAA
ncbi:MAG: phasin family protein [Rubrivivax sp.]|nr:phasin family protein [Rubrivivax sp.]MDP3086551.1 phasin family protein [Rubrivivax sp.]